MRRRSSAVQNDVVVDTTLGVPSCSYNAPSSLETQSLVSEEHVRGAAGVRWEEGRVVLARIYLLKDSTPSSSLNPKGQVDPDTVLS